MNLTVRRDDSTELHDHVECYHYLHRYPDPRSLPFGYRLVINDADHAKDGRLFGVIVMKKPQHHRQAGLFGYEGLPTAWQVLDLARVWIHPYLQNVFMYPAITGLDRAKPYYMNRQWYAQTRQFHGFSRFVSLMLRRVQSDWLEHHPPVYPDLPYHIRLIISYCELSHHDGKAYRACSFERFGATADGSKELYVKHLRQPRKAWRPIAPVQMPLLDGMPLVHGGQS